MTCVERKDDLRDSPSYASNVEDLAFCSNEEWGELSNHGHHTEQIRFVHGADSRDVEFCAGGRDSYPEGPMFSTTKRESHS